MEHCWAGGGIAKYASLRDWRPVARSDRWQIMPWDSDIDVQVSLPTMDFLARYYNMTMHHYSSPEMPPGGRNYMFEINPGYVNGSPDDWLNVIDARWIDTETGVFIDITTARPKPGEKGVVQIKDQHQYEVSGVGIIVRLKTGADDGHGTGARLVSLTRQSIRREAGQDTLQLRVAA